MSAIGPTETTTGAAAGPSFYLNNSAAFSSAGLANTSLFGAGFTYPSAPTPSAASQVLNTGFYVNPTTGKFVSAGGVSFADPYLSGRAPEIVMFNAGFERGITQNLTLAVNYVGNFSYNSLQINLIQRLSNGLTFNVNYTYAKNIGDDGTFRSGFDIPAAAISHGTRSWRQDRIERGDTAISMPHTFHAFGVYELPFGKGHIGSDSRLVRWLAGGWQLSGTYSASSGTPMRVTWSGCNASTYPGQGQCMPDLNSAFTGHSARINGSFGKGPGGVTTCNLGIGPGCKAIQYVDSTAFSTPENVSTTDTAQYLLGNAPRTLPLGLRNPGAWNLDTGLRRIFSIRESMSFVFEADSLNTWNHVLFNGPNASWSSGSTSFGTFASFLQAPKHKFCR